MISDEALFATYTERYDTLLFPIASALEGYLRSLLRAERHVDRVSARAKTAGSFVTKASTMTDGVCKYKDPMTEIQDQIGARIVTFYVSDIERIEKLVGDYFGSIETRRVEPESSSEFGYEGHHYILLLPDEAFPRPLTRKTAPAVFELQVKTVFQHAWGAAGHDLIYKSAVPLTREHLRKAAFTAAQAWGADQMFKELTGELLGDSVTH